MNGVQTRFKCKLDVKRCKRFVFPPSSLLPRSNALKTKAIRYFQTDRTLTRIVSPPLYDATNIRLRELSLSYSLPQALLAKTGFIKGLQISLIGRNLFFFKNNAPYDPDGLMSTSNRLQGVDVFGMPTNRSFGFNLKVNF